MLLTEKEQKRIFTISAPSGTGKNTVIDKIIQKNNHIEHAISTTTRKPRGNERNGVEYYFINKNEFESMIEQKEFLEWAKVLDHCYGTSIKEIHRILNQNKKAVLDIDIQGAFQLKRTYPYIRDIFLIPPSLEVLRERLEKRNTEKKEQIDKRLQLAEKELKEKEKFTVTIVNDKLDETISSVEEAILSDE